MYTADIGRQFLNLYNEKTGKNWSAEEFFEEAFFPLFFDTADYLHLMQVTNSSFFQKVSDKEKESGLPEPQIKKDRFYNQLENVANKKQPVSGAIGVGYMAGEVEKGTSGQVSNVSIDFDKETLLCTWFGGALGVGFGGGYDVLFNDPEINWFIYQGWQYYRHYINETPNMKGRQIETWNGLWLLYGFKENLAPDKIYKQIKSPVGQHLSQNKKVFQLQRPNNWLEQVTALAKAFRKSDKNNLLGYAYNFGQMNKTVGFFYIQLPQIRRLNEIYDQYLAKDPEIGRESENALENVFKTQYNLETAIAQGGIGVKALKPKDLYKFTAGSKQKEVANIPKLDKEAKRIQFITYKTWLTAMLNNEQTLELTQKLAQDLLHFVQGDKRKTTRERTIEELWEASNRQQMINQLVAIQSEEPDLSETLNQTVNKLMTELPQDNFRLFLTLTKFKYHYFLNTQQQETTVQ